MEDRQGDKPISTRYNYNPELKLREEIFKWGLQQINDILNNQGSFLDLTFTNDPSAIIITDAVEIKYLDRSSHHHSPSCLTIINRLPPTDEHIKKLRKNFSKMNIKHIKNQINMQPIFDYSFEKSMFVAYNEKNGILNRINSYINFITQCQNTNTL